MSGSVESFDYLREGDYVRYARDLVYDWSSLPQSELWVDEPRDCVLQIERMVDQGEPDSRCFHMRCVMDCGAHAVLKMTEAEYEEACQCLDYSLLVFSGMCDISEIINPPEQELEYDVERDAANIYERTVTGDWPDPRKIKWQKSY